MRGTVNAPIASFRMLWCALAAATFACGQASAPEIARRDYLMGFSSAPPRLTIEDVLRTIDLWTPRADAALLALTVPWKSMLADTSAALLIRREQLELVRLYRARGLRIVAMVDATDGLAREREAPELVALGRSIREPAVQQVYREYVMAVDSILEPEYLVLAMETNLVRLAAPRDVYDSLRTMTNAAAAALTAGGSRAKLCVSVQVETAWGRLGGPGTYVGIAQDLQDFPFSQALGLSSYPYLGGFAEPEDVPLDYYSRLAPSPALPMLVVEGGWSSASVPGVTSSPDKQARYIARQMRIADSAQAAAIFQITFTDLDLALWPVPPGSILPLFAGLGLVDTEFRAKPALAEWDKVFARKWVPR